MILDSRAASWCLLVVPLTCGFPTVQSFVIISDPLVAKQVLFKNAKNYSKVRDEDLHIRLTCSPLLSQTL